ncbi:CHAT domain-containing protein [Plectonema cf. radiosum LEGE 06105]|uniref:CHAT domain-containing protein n=1 Tax=Plectonema cf. radiosum LEGE 06105 TaxID=945769 RepID=A0A8J7F9L9_9CYAN|nr:cell division protein HetF [Plectonema radiosum]MBE9216935.1 CHAT domain-containing protein [Plectonema cf. radiosum LEGE 06105]
MTQEFHISVTPVGQNDYLVRTEQVAPGVPLAEELVRWPVADWLAAAGSLMNDPLQSVLQGDAMALSACLEETNARNSVNLVALGQQLYNALFQGTLRDSWITAQGIAQNHQQVLRLRLGLKDTKLARLPWEVMHQGDRPIATGPYIAFSRYQSGMSGASRLPSRNIPQLSNEGGIKVLMVIASPADQVRLNLLKQEAIRLQAELERKTQNGGAHLPEIQLSVLEQPGREELTQALEQGNYHVLHYSGHSNFGANGGEIYLVSGRTGLTETLYGDDLAGLLINNNIQMAVFNSCLGTYAATLESNPDTGQRNLTETLVKRGIKSILAMSERIPDEVALTLTQLFYRNLSQGYAIDLCVSRMRQGLISAYSSHQLYWALPILYLQPEFDGYLDPEVYLSPQGELFSEYDPTASAASALYASIPTHNSDAIPMEGEISYEPEDSLELDWLGENTWGDLVDEIEYDDSSYSEDSAIVTDLFRQLDDEKSLSEPPMNAELVQQFDDDYQQKQLSPDLDYQSEDTLIWNESEYLSQVSSQTSTLTNETSLQDSLTRNWQQDSQVTTESAKAAAKKQKQQQRLAVFGVFGISVIALFVSINYFRGQQKPDILQPAIVQEKQFDLKIAQTEAVTTYASEKLSQGNIDAGLEAVEELLNRGALNNAEIALENVNREQLVKNPDVNFIKGRLAWQFVQKGNNKYSIDDARRFWKVADGINENSFLYKNALGFAYYAEGDLNRANDSWLKALDLTFKKNPAQNVSLTSAPQVIDQEALSAYAGLALSLYQSSMEQTSDKKEKYLNEAIKLRRMVMKDAKGSFERNHLAQNWLWTEKAIEDWQSLLKLE